MFTGARPTLFASSMQPPSNLDGTFEKIAGQINVVDTLVHVMRHFQDSNAMVICTAGQVLHIFALNIPHVADHMVDAGTADFLWLLLLQNKSDMNIARVCIVLLNDMVAKCRMLFNEFLLNNLLCCIVNVCAILRCIFYVVFQQSLSDLGMWLP